VSEKQPMWGSSHFKKNSSGYHINSGT
jgi:hypothetical protein